MLRFAWRCFEANLPQDCFEAGKSIKKAGCTGRLT